MDASRSSGGSPGRSPGRGAVTANELKEARAWRTMIQDPWDPCILTLDGGGIRGYSSALILKTMMDAIHTFERRQEEMDPTGDIPESADDLLPCHYFDYMYGTSTGGLIAIMLARLRMTVGECLEQYRLVGEQLFGKRRTVVPFLTKYHAYPLETAVKDLVQKRGLGIWHSWDKEFKRGTFTEQGAFPMECGANSDKQASVSEPRPQKTCSPRPDGFPPEPVLMWPDSPQHSVTGPQFYSEPSRMSDSITTLFEDMWDPSAPKVCQSCCLTAINDNNIRRAHLLRSYSHYYTTNAPSWITPYNQGAEELEIWQTTRATSAAPFYFDMLEAEVKNLRNDYEKRGYKDGGIRENNPSVAAFTEFASMYPRKGQPALLLSIGTGRTTKSPDGFMSALPWPFGHFGLLRSVAQNSSIIKQMVVKLTDSEEKHNNMIQQAKGVHTWYRRLNVSEGLENMPLDDWRTGTYEGQDVPGGASLSRMHTATTKYLERGFDRETDIYVPPKEMIEQIAEKLVRVRRERRRMGGLRWTTYIGEDLEKRRLRTNIAMEAEVGAGAP